MSNKANKARNIEQSIRFAIVMRAFEQWQEDMIDEKADMLFWEETEKYYEPLQTEDITPLRQMMSIFAAGFEAGQLQAALEQKNKTQ